MIYERISRDNLIDWYLQDLDLYIDTQGKQGALQYITYPDISRAKPKIANYEWQDLIIDIAYESEAIALLNKLLREPEPANAGAFKQWCRKYAIGRFMEDVIDHKWDRMDKSEKKGD